MIKDDVESVIFEWLGFVGIGNNGCVNIGVLF